MIRAIGMATVLALVFTGFATNAVAQWGDEWRDGADALEGREYEPDDPHDDSYCVEKQIDGQWFRVCRSSGEITSKTSIRSPEEQEVYRQEQRQKREEDHKKQVNNMLVFFGGVALFWIVFAVLGSRGEKKGGVVSSRDREPRYPLRD